MIDVLLNCLLILSIIILLILKPIRNWIDKDISDKFQKKLKIVENGTTLAVVGISDDPKDFNRKLLLFKDLETDRQRH